MSGELARSVLLGWSSRRYQSLGEGDTGSPEGRSRGGPKAGSLVSASWAESVLSIPYPSVWVSRWSGSISPNRIGWEGGEDGGFGGGEDGLLDALLRERCDMDLDVDGAPPASPAVFGLLILLANDAPLFCGRSAVVFARWEALGTEPELLDAWRRGLEPCDGRGPVLED